MLTAPAIREVSLTDRGRWKALMARGKPLADRDVPCVQTLQGHTGAMACWGSQCAVRVLGQVCD